MNYRLAHGYARRRRIRGWYQALGSIPKEKRTPGGFGPSLKSVWTKRRLLDYRRYLHNRHIKAGASSQRYKPTLSRTNSKTSASTKYRRLRSLYKKEARVFRSKKLGGIHKKYYKAIEAKNKILIDMYLEQADKFRDKVKELQKAIIELKHRHRGQTPVSIHSSSSEKKEKDIVHDMKHLARQALIIVKRDSIPKEQKLKILKNAIEKAKIAQKDIKINYIGPQGRALLKIEETLRKVRRNLKEYHGLKRAQIEEKLEVIPQGLAELEEVQVQVEEAIEKIHRANNSKSLSSAKRRIASAQQAILKARHDATKRPSKEAKKINSKLNSLEKKLKKTLAPA